MSLSRDFAHEVVNISHSVYLINSEVHLVIADIFELSQYKQDIPMKFTSSPPLMCRNAIGIATRVAALTSGFSCDFARPIEQPRVSFGVIAIATDCRAIDAGEGRP